MQAVFIILYTSFIIFILMGFYVLRLDHRNMQNLSFFLVCVCCAWWSLTFAFMFPASSPEQALFWFRLSLPGWIMVAGTSLHCLLALSNDPALEKRWVYAVIYLPGLIFLYGALAGYFTEVKYVETYGFSGGTVRNNPVWYWSFSVYYLGYIFFGFWKMVRWGKNSSLQIEKKQARLVTNTASVSIVLVFVVGTLLPAIQITSIPRIPSVMALIMAAGMWVAITRYRLLTLNLAVASDEIITRIEDLLFLMNPAGNITRINPSVETILGYRERELTNYPAEMIFVEKDRPRFLSLVQRLQAGTLERFQEELSLQAKNGEHIPARISAASLKDLGGDLGGILLVGRDMRETRQLQEEISERKKIEAELHQSLEKLQELDQLKTDFISSVSHELRTPLTSIMGFASIIKKRFEEVLLPLINMEEKKTARATRQLQENIGIIISEGQRLTALINEVLDIAKMEAGRIEWKMEKLELHEIVKRATAAIAPLFEEKGLSLNQELAADLLPLQGDGDRLVQVLINLLSNGMKFTETGGVTVRATRHGTGEILVQVVDTGIGIRPEDQEKVFEKFKQAGDTLTDKPRGTGLGLPICREIVEHHGGYIWVESMPGEGSSFNFILPLLSDKVLSGGDLLAN